MDPSKNQEDPKECGMWITLVSHLRKQDTTMKVISQLFIKKAKKVMRLFMIQESRFKITVIGGSIASSLVPKFQAGGAYSGGAYRKKRVHPL